MTRHTEVISEIANKYGAERTDFVKSLLRVYLDERAEYFFEEMGELLRSVVPDAYKLEKVEDESVTLSACDGMPVRYRLTIYEVEVSSFLNSYKWGRYSHIWDELANYGIEVVVKTVDRYGSEIQHDMADKYIETLLRPLSPSPGGHHGRREKREH